MTLRFGSVCSGIEAASIAWEPLGWHPQFYSEIEPFPCAVLHEHWSSGRPSFMPDPDEPGLSEKDAKARRAAIKAVSRLPAQANGVPNFGDMTQFEEWPDADIDVLVGGTPCQSYSVAGLRKGLDDPRGDLMLTYVAIARRYRPRWVVWENVFGVLSSNGGRDFASLLGLLSGRRVEVPSGGWRSSGIVEGYERAYGLSWRVLDTQYVRVDGAPRALPQRRRRVFVVGHIGGDWRRAAAVLLERHGLSGHPAPSRKPGERVAPTISARTKGGGGLGTDFDLDGGLIRTFGIQGNMIGRHDSAGPAGSGFSDDVSFTLTKTDIHGVAYAPEIARCVATREGSSQDYETTTMVAVQTLDGSDVARTLSARHDGSPCVDRGPDAVVCFTAKDYGADAQYDLPPTLRAGGHSGSHANAGVMPAVAYGAETACVDSQLGSMVELATTLRRDPGGLGYSINTTSGVRRLTPTECARLQGFPDNHCSIPWRGKPAEQCPDGPQYKAYGNSMSTNVMRWLGERIQFVDQIERADA